MYLRTCVPASERTCPPGSLSPPPRKVKNTNVPAYLRQSVRVHQEPSPPPLRASEKHAGTQVRRYTSTQVRRYTGTQVRRYAGTFASASASPPAPALAFSFFVFFVFFRVFRVPRVLRQPSVTFASITISLSVVYAAIRKVFLQQTPDPSCTPPLFFVPLHMRTNATTREGRCQYTQKGQSVRNKAPKRTHPITP